MERRNRRPWRPEAEGLEVRRCPAVSANVVSGTLMIVGDSTGANLRLTQVDASTFDVQDGATPVGRFSGVTRDVNVALGDGKDALTIDLNGQTTPRGLNIATAAGDDTIAVGNGSIRRDLSISGGNGADAVTIGGPAGAITVLGSTTVRGGDGLGDSLFVGAGATLQGTLATGAVNVVNLGVGSVLQRGASLVGSLDASNAFALGGRVDRDVFVYGGRAADSLTVAGPAILSRDLSANLGAGNDVATLDARVGADLLLDAGNGDDSATIAAGAGGRTTVRLGSGSDSLGLAGVIGRPEVGRGRSIGGLLGRLFGRSSGGRSSIDAGSGADLVTITSALTLNGPVDLRMGAGDDTLAVSDAPTPLDLRADGGTGLDTFRGRKERLRLTPTNFEVFA